MTEEIIYNQKLINVENDYEHIKQLVNLKAEQYKQTLDYITNLQQENEKLKYNARGQVNDYFKDKYADEVLKKADLIKDFELTCYKNYELKKENEKLKNEKEEYKECFNLMAKFRDKALERELIYKSRCEKANKLLKTIYKALPGTYNQLLIEIDNYLQGSDEK